MRRSFTQIVRKNITSEIKIMQTTQIIFEPKKKIKMQEESEHLAEVKNLSSTDKGEWLEVKTKEAMEAEGFTVTIIKAQRWDKNKREMQIIGDNGVDGITRIRINEYQYNGIIQCKYYAATTRISTDVIAQIDNNLDHWKMERSFGILVMLTKGSLNQRAIKLLKMREIQL